jgi:predicted nuclease of predicted toxin-antitoxin system
LKVCFDEDVPHKLARFLPQQIQTVVSMEWGGVKNGALLKLIESERFDAFLTGDKNMETQQRLEGRPFAVLIMSAINWRWSSRIFIKSPLSSTMRGLARS